MKTARQRLLEHIKFKGRVSASELSRALRMTPANVRHHLQILIEEGAVEIAGKNQAQGRGRPTFLYAVSLQSRQNNLGALSGALLDELLKGLSGEARTAILKRLALRMSGEGEVQGISLAQRLNHTVKHLNEQHYEARWEAHADAPHLILGHCPYAEVLADHPELCQVDAFHLENLVGAPVQQKTKLARNSRGGTTCLFIIEKNR